MFITLINDCTDENVKGRLGTRISSLFNITPTFISVGSNLQAKNEHDPAEYEAAGNIIDVLDAAGDSTGAILINVANRHGKGKRWPNGTPFGYFYIKNTLIVSTIDGLVLSLVKKLKLREKIYVLDIPSIMSHLSKNKIIAKDLSNQIANTQFRSFEFQPRIAKWLLDKISIPAESFPLKQVAEISGRIWSADNFGNCKTTYLPQDLKFQNGKRIKTKFGYIRCFNFLKDIPDHETALIIGSSGYERQRFIEFVIQGESAAKKYNLHPGSEII